MVLQDIDMEISTLDLFCGGGGSSWGAQNAGSKIVAGIDAWDRACETFKQNFPSARAVNAVLNGRSSRKTVGDVGDIDLILASPECTNHTCARGNRPRDESSRRTANFVLNYARLYKPRWVVLENVVQMRSWDGYRDLVAELERDYFVNIQTLDASEFGVPQKRRRLFILCDREVPPAKVQPNPDTRRVSASEILEPTGAFNTKPLFHNGRAEPTLARARRAIEALGEGTPFLIVYYGSDGSGGWQSLDRPLRTLTTLDRFGLVEWNRGGPTLRMLQIPELRRAMGFGESFRLEHGTRRDRIRILGNGVCPPVMEAIVGTITGQRANALSQRTLQLVAAE